MDEILLNQIPYDLIYQVLNDLDCKELFQVCKSLPLENNYILTLARKKVFHQTGLHTNDFDMKKLESLSDIIGILVQGFVIHW